MKKRMIEDLKMPSATALRSSAAVGTLLRVAVTAASAIGAAYPASAQFWRDTGPGYSYYPQRQIIRPPHQQRTRRAASKKEIVKDTAVHPQMPLIINVSIARQRVTVYDANGLFAEAPVSTGMRGHPTPMGVFSVIQKDRYHHSNIYSGAPMPFMQRITWGGVALHAGVLPGYPASHGCIRMPESFAVKMWGWTKLGARVIVTPGELSPLAFSHPLLPAMKVVPQPLVAEQPETNDPLGAKADKGAAAIKPIEASLELRSTVGHSDAAGLGDRTHTSEAGGDVRANTALDAPATPKADEAKPEGANAASPALEMSTNTVGKDAKSADATPSETTADGKPAGVADARPAEAATTETKPGGIAAKPAGKTAKPGEAANIEPAEIKPDTPKADTLKADAPKSADRQTEPVKAADAATPPAPADAKKDQTRLTDIKPAAKPQKRREGQVAVFISRKDSKLYVRHNFAPWFEMPVTISPSDRPLGTHVFTADVDKTDSNVLHWTVVTVPMSARAAMRQGDMPRASRRRGKNAPAPVEAKAVPMPDSPAEALDRISVPAEVMARISEALATGGSIIVSDQGINQGETGEYTDFIIRTY
jgi:lipoprotein-anchoring transpeptidase ErfK/SrfK